VLIPSLDLKFFVHSGSYVVRRIARTEELTGADVVLVHRLLKGSARDVVGNDAYLVVTGAALDAMDGDFEALGLTQHVEHFDVGEVVVYIENLQAGWETEESRTHGVVSPERAIGSFSFVFQGTPRQLWPWFTDPRRRLEWQEGLTNIDEFVEGRRGVGTVSHCAHGGSVSVQQMLDWRPFTSFTTRDEHSDLGAVITVTTSFDAVDAATNVTMSFACDPEEGWDQIEAGLYPSLERSGARLSMILADTTNPIE